MYAMKSNMTARNISKIILLLVIWMAIYVNLQTVSDFVVEKLLNMEAGKHLTESVRFFIFEAPKVFLLLVLVIFIVGIIRSYFSPERTRKALEGKPLFAGNIMAAVLGIVTPFCSCSAIPLFIGFVEAGIPLGITFSFLIAAPMINEVALVLMAGLFGWKVALIYIATGLSIAIVAGYILEKLNMQKYVADWVYQVNAAHQREVERKLSLNNRIDAGFNAVKDILGRIWIYIVAGIAIGASVHGYVPDAYLANALGIQNWYSVPLAIAVGVPLYSNAAGIVPIVSVLIDKGVSLGTALAFMMSVIGLSLPEMIILKKILKWQLIAVFIGVVAAGIAIVGIIFNHILLN